MAAPGLYLHVPFCSAICPYCDFSVLKAGVSARKRFVEHLVAEVPLATREWVEAQPFDTVYFGGGTPSQLPPEDLGRVVAACREHLSIVPDAWVFLEVNPEDVTPEACTAWRGLGVRTLSLGIQAFSDDALRFLGRRHSAEQARAAVETALAADFHTVSVDLIFGLPGQSPEA
ncbi:MAG TPA: radical SAM protein, partial [Vicinamibacteria bacterium]|nr:radical SAM protein [Vicinamibacteria bacterium]